MNNILINIDNFMDLTIDDTYINNNNQGSTLLKSLLNGKLSINKTNILNNDGLSTLMDIDGITTLNLVIIISDNSTNRYHIRWTECW